MCVDMLPWFIVSPSVAGNRMFRLTKGKLVNKLVTKGNLVSRADRGGKNPGKETGNVDKTAKRAGRPQKTCK